MSDGRAALLLIQTVKGEEKQKANASSDLPFAGWIWSGEPQNAAPVASSVITHPDLVEFFRSSGVLLQVTHRVVTRQDDWQHIRDDIDAVWYTLSSSWRSDKNVVPAIAEANRAEPLSLRIPRAQGELGYQYRDFRWRRPTAADCSMASVLRSAVDVASSSQCGDDPPPVPRRPAPHLIELHTTSHPAGLRLADESAILKRVDDLLRGISEAAERARQSDPFRTLDDRLQAALLYLYRQGAFAPATKIPARRVVDALSSAQAKGDLREVENRINELTKLITPYRPYWIGSVRGQHGGYYLEVAGRRFVLAAIERLGLDPVRARWPGGGGQS